MKSKDEGGINTVYQIDRFREAAYSLGCDEDKAAFDEKLRGVARQRAKNQPAKLPES